MVQNRYTKFCVAIQNGRLDEVERMLAEGDVDATAHNSYPARLAAKRGHMHILDRLEQIEGVDVADYDSIAIAWASLYGHLAMVERLLGTNGIDAAARGNLAIYFAAESGHLHVVKRLLQESGVLQGIVQHGTIGHAAKKGHLDIVNCLLEMGVDAAAHDNLAIRCAAKYGHLDIVERLLLEPSVMKNIEALFSALWVGKWAHELLGQEKSHINIVAAFSACSLPREKWINALALELYDKAAAYRRGLRDVLQWMWHSECIRQDVVNVVCEYCVGVSLCEYECI